MPISRALRFLSVVDDTVAILGAAWFLALPIPRYHYNATAKAESSFAGIGRDGPLRATVSVCLAVLRLVRIIRLTRAAQGRRDDHAVFLARNAMRSWKSAAAWAPQPQ